MSAARPVPPITILSQHQASDPAASAWVSANAGSGKTHVLAQRVVRLLLAGTPPGRILCLTFTKTAAANMSERVFRTLAEWTLLDDAALDAAIASTGAPRAGASGLIAARRLFARTIETPGGLKIQTIHAFCERLLHMFPFEANVSAGFEVIEPPRQGELMGMARLATLEAAIHDEGALGSALRALSGDASEGTFTKVLTEALKFRADLAKSALEVPGAALAAHLGLNPGETPASIALEMLNGGIAPERWPALALWLDGGIQTDRQTAGKLRDAAARMDAGDPEGALAGYLGLFFKADGEARKKLVMKTLASRNPEAAAMLEAEAPRLEAALGRQRAAAAVERTAALVTLTLAIFARYEQLKAERSLIDFEDLILRTQGLLSRSEAAWVLYKLDSGIDHILVDEAQDTSPAQWEILKALASDFTAGAGQRIQRRTIFAVGDEKQSIYSFQGAAPHKFAEMKREFGSRAAAAGQNFAAVRLELSFRSAPEILQAVDRVFGVPENYRGLSADSDQKPTVHTALKTDVRGHVEIWPPIAESESDIPPNWQLPLDSPDSNAPASRLAQRIAKSIAAMTGPGSLQRVRDSRSGAPRPVRAGDILILVRARNSFFDAVIRALKEHSVPVAGADRLTLTSHIAVMDLMAAGRVALLPLDDLSLASLLKSPLIGLEDDDLITLAPGRQGTLMAALQAAPDDRFRRARRQLARWRGQAQAMTPFQFYASLLGADGGRRALMERLGHEAGDAIDEFLSLALAHEALQAPSLATFLAGLEAADLEIKRDMEAAGEAVRVMTVHAAKGLEAKIVFLPDTCSRPGAPRDPAIFRLEPGQGGDDMAAGILAWSPRMAEDPAAVAEARMKIRGLAVEENRRLLYVAMTRAEERLYISGFCGTRGPAEGCWHTVISAALTPHLTPVPAPWDGATQIWRSGTPLEGAPVDAAQAPARAGMLPAWLTSPAAPEPGALPPLRPSQALEAADRIEPADPEASLTRQAAKASGRHLHVLLQYVPGVARAERHEAGRRYLSGQTDLPDARMREALLQSALAIAEDPRLQPLFGQGSLAEVPVAGHILRADGRRIEIAGQIDRLAILPGEVIVADFKTGRPRGAGQTPAGIVTQLALYRALLAQVYPGKTVRALVVWTQGPQIAELEPAELDLAVERVRLA